MYVSAPPLRKQKSRVRKIRLLYHIMLMRSAMLEFSIKMSRAAKIAVTLQNSR
jgi:hypothetical protein